MSASSPTPSALDAATADLRTLVEASAEAYVTEPDNSENDEDDEDVAHPGTGITFGMVRRARVALDKLTALREAAGSGPGEDWRTDVANAPLDRQIEINVRAEWSPRSERWYVPGVGYPAMQNVTCWRDVAPQDNEAAPSPVSPASQVRR